MRPYIKVDIDELLDRLKEIQADGYTTVYLSINGNSDGYECDKLLRLGAFGLESDSPVDYGYIESNDFNDSLDLFQNGSSGMFSDDDDMYYTES